MPLLSHPGFIGMNTPNRLLPERRLGLFAVPVALLAGLSTASANVSVSFVSTTVDGAPPNTVTFVGDEVMPAVPAVVSVSLDGTGGATGSTTSNNTAVTDEWAVSGAASDGFGGSFTLTLTGRGNSGVVPIRQRFAGAGIGVNGGNPGRIDLPNTDFIDVEFDLTGLAPGLVLTLAEVGYDNTNSIAEDDPDLVLTGFDATATTYENVRNALTSPLDVSAQAATLASGEVGTISFSQGQTPASGTVGYSLASLSFDITSGSTDSGIPGDYNNDAIVNAADYTVFRDNEGTLTTLPNDTSPGSVTTGDYTVWANAYGDTSPPAAAVPEPHAACLTLFAVAMLRRR